MIRFFPFENFHGKRDVGSTRLRVHNLIKYWPDAGIYKYGENPDVMIYQKVYATQDYIFPEKFKNIQILDVCDPDWFDGAMIKNMSNLVDGITCPTESIKEFIAQLTKKPIWVIPDRHDIENIPKLKKHIGEAKKIVWFGYRQNAELLRFAIPTLERMGLQLTIISNQDPMAYRWALDPEEYNKSYHFKKFDEATLYKDLQKHDICILPEGYRPQDRFKSNNKTTISWLAGIPVAVNVEDLERLMDPVQRNKDAKQNREIAEKEYDVKLSVVDMKQFIDHLKVLRSE